MFRTRFLYLALALLIILSALSACAAQPKGPAIAISNPWARPSPMMAEMGAVYMVIVNNGNEADALVEVTSSIAKTVEIHQTVQEGDVMKMQPVPGQRLEIPAHGTVELKPGGYHIMLIGLEHPLQPGENITLTLRFEQSGEMTIEVPVREGP